jgi:hypothetical protein
MLKDASGEHELLQFDKSGVRGCRVVQAVTQWDERVIKREVGLPFTDLTCTRNEPTWIYLGKKSGEGVGENYFPNSCQYEHEGRSGRGLG